ncbi:sugar phosphate isomerase/epimerase family protein [Conexibacter sp. JD483]|uniref:sugar phosphate isomerase/epimerase family protein n=1 Tax=unclassified Conexibacter TaxID=2627773 RepID=UPI00271870F9|nr:MULTISPECIES: sugar phosphate isomerase/epimerase family protein [unclassified Conexibacter]MDO8186658.1 sugar phosphate isomerase/epimerase family protein [Conexibacter sp. CPCC 205706]MDO8200378.1 sugar phosphate isomerase/epimerase family protein [Conexibacter sp. CPCC 205762]MDR9370600.1 sugar phosphate isomerase/epimerase family protein [Conexibacter sp. JD483]
MSDVATDRPRSPQRLAGLSGEHPLDGRLGLAVSREAWPTAPELKRLEACGYAWVQLHAPPVAMLADATSARHWSDCLRAVLAPTGLRVVLHAPDALDLSVREHAAALAGLLGCAERVGAAIVVLHAGRAAGEEQLEREEVALLRGSALAERAGLRLALENLAPAYPIGADEREPAHAPLFVRDLVRRLDSPAVGMAFDVGHAHVTAQLDGHALVDVLDEVADDVALFHLHDNLGVRRGPGTPPGIMPLRLDLHMAPGRGTVPWRALAPLLREHAAPLVMEIASGHRPEPLRLATVSAELLTRA